MTHDFYGTKRVTAWPEAKQRQPDAEYEQGYAVKYADGYISWSPKKAFESAYQPLDALSFSHAIVALKEGFNVRRAGWNGKGMWLGLQKPDAGSKMGLPYIFMSTVDGKLVPWLASQTDMLADDWGIVG